MIKIAWDNYWKKHEKLILVLCGSVSSWIRDNIINNGAFVGRRSLDIVVRELSIAECAQFWGDRVARIDSREILDVLSVTGGVPRYLEEINPSLSANDNILRLCFKPGGILREDFNDMFSDAITRLPKFSGEVLRTLVDGHRNVSEICKALRIEKGGRVSDTLEQLEESGFVSRNAGRNPETGEKIREQSYRLKDNYARFYLKYIEPAIESIDGNSYDFGSLDRLPGWESIMGLQFENLVVNNYKGLLPKLHLANALVTSASPYRKSGAKGEGVQIDLLLQAKRFIYLIEVKRRNEIGREIIEEVERKVDKIKPPKGVSIRTALVYAGHLAPIIEAEGYFDSIVEIESLLYAQ